MLFKEIFYSIYYIVMSGLKDEKNKVLEITKTCK